jgi:hypothetical protein
MQPSAKLVNNLPVPSVVIDALVNGDAVAPSCVTIVEGGQLGTQKTPRTLV